ncbi:MAG TPA: hypothetical protein VFC79_00465 [Tissierellaceae bacterium]|nr:hypothetical protein [Tissierellaceae bacterium]
MPIWKLNIFVNAIKARIHREGKTAEELVEEYPKLTEYEKLEILIEIGV